MSSTWKIIGFDGNVKRADCGRVLPLVHAPESDTYFIYIDGEDALYHTKEEIEDFAREGRITLFPQEYLFTRILYFHCGAGEHQ